MVIFKVQGQAYHLIWSLLPAQSEQHNFLQIYFVGDEEREADIRCANVTKFSLALTKNSTWL